MKTPQQIAADYMACTADNAVENLADDPTMLADLGLTDDLDALDVDAVLEHCATLAQGFADMRRTAAALKCYYVDQAATAPAKRAEKNLTALAAEIETIEEMIQC